MEHFIGAAMLWSVAFGMVAAVPGGVALSVCAVILPGYSFAGGFGERMFGFAGGLALAASAAALIAQFGDAFAAVMF